MSTPSDVYGVELHITDTPESITALDVVPGDLVEVDLMVLYLLVRLMVKLLHYGLV